MNKNSGINSGLLFCHRCHYVSRHIATDHTCCARCGAPVHYRKPESYKTTWALTLTAMILLIPANVYPMMVVVYFGNSRSDTLMSGILHLAREGNFPVAVLVFIASVAVPVMKLLGLFIILLNVQCHWRFSRKQCTRLYRFIDLIGRWSMLDLFMIALLVTLIDQGKVSSIIVGPGATAFALVVVLTMLAVKAFDPRLLWDIQGASQAAGNGSSNDHHSDYKQS